MLKWLKDLKNRLVLRLHGCKRYRLPNGNVLYIFPDKDRSHRFKTEHIDPDFFKAPLGEPWKEKPCGTQ
jgi:hypothetical protein